MSENRLWWAHLCEGSPRYQEWKKILGSNDVPLKSAASGHTQLGPEEKVEVYEVAISKLDAGQRQRLVDFIQERFRETREAVEQNLDEEGFPIRAEDVLVAFSLRAFI
jgi:hypothetical protein